MDECQSSAASYLIFLEAGTRQTTKHTNIKGVAAAQGVN
jgi:hypothetical protein